MQALMDSVASILKAAAKSVVLPSFREANALMHKADGSWVTRTDQDCQEFIRQQLEALDSDIRFLAEEGRHADFSTLSATKPFWCLDPLDGTSNFCAGIPLFAISLAFIADGKVQLACIHDPIRRETFTALRGGGFRLNGRLVKNASYCSLASAVGYIDLKRLDARQKDTWTQPGLYHSQRNLGSCALEWAWLAAGRGHFIVHGGQKLWDFAAGSLMIEESGGVVTDFSGRALGIKPKSSVLAAHHPRLHAQLLETAG